MRRLYLCDDASKYRDLSVNVAVSKQFAKVLEANAPADGRMLVGVEPLTNAFSKECLEDVVAVWSLPSDLFNCMRVDRHEDGGMAIVERPITDYPTFFALMDDADAGAVDPERVPHTFFKVVAARPENLKAVLKGGRANPSNFSVEMIPATGYCNEIIEEESIEVRRHQVVKLADSHLGFTERVINLDTRGMASPASLSLLTAWETIRTSTIEKLAQWVIDGIHGADALLPSFDSISDELVVDVPSVADTGYDAYIKPLVLLRAANAVTTEGGVSKSSAFLIAGGCTLEVIEKLVASGALVRTWDHDFLEHVVAMQPSALQPSMSREIVLCNPTSIINITPPSIMKSQSKLALYLQCRRTGWIPTDAILSPRKSGDPKLFELRMVERSYMYFLTMLNEEDVYARGSTCIYHGLSQGYYKCLLNVGNLQDLHVRADFKKLRDKDFEAKFRLI